MILDSLFHDGTCAQLRPNYYHRGHGVCCVDLPKRGKGLGDVHKVRQAAPAHPRIREDVVARPAACPSAALGVRLASPVGFVPGVLFPARVHKEKARLAAERCAAAKLERRESPKTCPELGKARSQTAFSHYGSDFLRHLVRDGICSETALLCSHAR